MDYGKLKVYYDTILNKDKSLFNSSNDEPTPIDCVEDMLDKVPSHFWKHHDLKILDPCCGNGNFHLVIHKKYNIQLQNLYFNDINPNRLKNVKKIFGENINVE